MKKGRNTRRKIFLISFSLILLVSLMFPGGSCALTGSITGKVSNPRNGMPMEKVLVSAYVYDTSLGLWAVCQLVETDSEGKYSLASLSAGNYKLEFRDLDCIALYNNGKSDLDSADLVTVTGGQTTGNINAQINCPRGTISGKVTDATGKPLAGIDVSGTNQIGFPLYSTKTDSSGNYSLTQLEASSYAVKFEDLNFWKYRVQYYNAKTAESAADQITVSDGNDISNINARLVSIFGSIKGTVTGPGGARIKGIGVVLYGNTTGSGSYQVKKSTVTGGSGQYAFSDLAKGQYKIKFWAPDGLYKTQFYSGKLNLAAANAISIDGDNLVLNAELKPDYKPSWVASWGREKTYDGGASHLALDKRGNVFVGGHGANIPTIVRFNRVGRVGWIKSISGFGGTYHNFLNEIAVDGEGNVIATVTIYHSSGKTDVVTVKYDTDGKLLWSKRFGGATCSSMGADTKGNVFVVGFDGRYRGSLVKYNKFGKQIWVRRNNNYFSEISLDGKGNILCASGGGLGTNQQITVHKYSTFGKLSWKKSFIGKYGASKRYTSIEGLAIDGNGSVFIAAAAHVPKNLPAGASELYKGYDFLTVKFSPLGRVLWSKFYNGSANRYDSPEHIAVDSKGNVAIAGISDAIANDYGGNHILMKYGSAGRRLWVKKVSGIGASDICINAKGEIYITGKSTLKYSPAGKILWSKKFPSGKEGSAIAIDATGNPFATGDDFLTVKYKR